MRFAVAIVTLALASVRLASAQPAPVDEPPPAAKLFGEGLALLDAGKFAEACAAFAASYKLEPSAVGTMLNLGICHEQLGKLATALRWYRRAQARSSEMSLSASEAEAKGKALAVAARVATIAVKVSNAPADATVRLDGDKVEAVDLARIEVDAGHHVLELGVTPPIKKEVDVADGARVDVELAVPLPPAPKRYVVLDPGKAERGRAWWIGASGVGAVAASAAFGLVALAVDDNTQPRRRNLNNALLFGATPVAVLGIAAITYSVVRYRRAPRKERREVAPPVAPLIGQDHAGLVFTRAF